MAAETVLQIVKLDGAMQSVTDEQLAELDQITLITPLVGHPDDKGGEQKTHQVTGARMRDVLAHFSIEGSVADASAIDSYRIDIPVEDAMKYDVILATTVDGKKLSIRDRGPLWVVYPLGQHPELQSPTYEARSIWQLKEFRMK